MTEPTLEQLNELQSEGIVSDLCVTWQDVAPCDQQRAFAWLEQQRVQKMKAEQNEWL